MCAAEPKTVEPEPGSVTGQGQRAVADKATAQQRRRLCIAQVVGQREAVARVGDGTLGIATVDVAAREPSMQAEVLLA